tara:strand:+ start:68 stop:655 length:588 start_codon:yes stop_codon:yes gene_type:complete
MKNNLNSKIRQTILELLKDASEVSVLSEQDSQENQETPNSEPSPSRQNKKQKKASPGEIRTAGAFGSGGRARAFVTDAKARAETDPEGLMEDLGIKSASSGDDLFQVQSLFNMAIHGNPVMSDAYAGARLNVEKPSGSDSPVKAVLVTMGGLDRKNGVRFMAHTLVAAQAAGLLSLAGGLQFAQGTSSDIMVYSI